MKPKVTIGVCVKNGEEFIKEAIDSILKQDYPQELMELIFIDESEDNTLSIIRESISEIDIPVKIIHISGKGLGYSRNLVIKYSKGDYVLWVDGDMILIKNFVRKQVEFMENHTKIGIARGQQALLPSTNLLGTLEAYSRVAGRMVNYQSEEGSLKALGTGGAIYRKEIFSDIIRFDDGLKGYCEDWDVELKVRQAGWLLALTDVKYRDNERFGLSWKKIWTRYWRRGFYTHYFLHKHEGVIKHYRMFPIAAIISGLLHSKNLFKCVHEKKVFLIPIHNFLKMIAWYIGYIKSHCISYQPQ